jgi:hypothetical protein
MICFLIGFFNAATAQELEPRSYSVIPTRFNMIGVSGTFSQGNVVTDATLPIKDLKITSLTFATIYVRSFSFLGKLGKVQMLLPYTFIQGSVKINGVDTAANRSGFADARIKVGLNLLGSPAMAPKDFVRFNEESVLGASIVISVPTGLYLPEKVINIGSNRWGFKPEIGFSHRTGHFYFETYAGVWFFTKNNQYMKTSQLEQAPIFTFQAHVSHIFPKKNWVAINGGYANGGQTSVNGNELNNFQKNWRVGGTYSQPLNKHSSLRALLNTGVATRAGGDFTSFTLSYQYGWF